MSGLAGVYRRDGQSADAFLLGRMTDLIAHRGPDGEGHWANGQVALGHRMSCTTPESAGEKQPLLDETGALCLTLDGRVDNREELAAWLRSAGAHLRTNTDGEIVLHAYAVWGDACPERIVGDFAFAVWDGRRRRLFCARDPLGIRPFYYCDDRRAVLWGSELRQIVDAMGRTPEPNEGILGEYLCNRLVDQGETLYRGILRLPPGHVLTIESGEIRTRRYFDIDPRREIRYGHDGEYAEHFRAILREAVRCRLRSPSPVAVFLSGGLDSSSIVGMAGRLATEGVVPASAFETYSLDFSHPAADERDYVDDVAALWKVPIHRVSADRVDLPSLAEQVTRLHDFPDVPTTHPWGRLYDAAERRGSRVTVWGYGGDEWLTGTPMHCADLLRRRRLLALARQVRDDLRTSARLGGPKAGPTDALEWCLLPLIPTRAKQLARRMRGVGVPSWIAPDFAKRISLPARLARRAADPPFPTFAQRAIYRQLGSGWSTAEYEMVDRFEARRSMESRCPFNDRRLIEFALALPEDQRWRGTETKFILRRAGQDLLPASVARRPTKGDFTYLFAESVEREVTGGVLDELRLADDGFVNGGHVREMYRRLHEGDARLLGPLWMILAAEWWYRTMFPASQKTRSLEETA